ncbi:TonB family protein [Acinetobacter boissieri]|uniref:Outer membrane transport energization protein TonB n=1 Tax=Acinetobacter boissieri TaxID=1219383 RepID=A0A1G6GIN0_9GAMM|nr:TonB family protein [Acinetobacter boissieri]SDB81871.1 outer membrane transport energization protein TonB [Acinetobacter boissieri]
MSMYVVYQHRKALSWCPAVCIGAYLLFLAQPDVLKIEPKYDEKPIEITLAAPPEPVVTPPTPVVQAMPEPEAPPEDAIVEEKPKPKVVEPIKQKPIQPKIEPKVKPVEKVEQKVQKTPAVEAKVTEKVLEKPVEKPAPVAEKVQEAPKAKAEPVVAEKPKPAPPATTGNHSAEASYLNKVKSAVEQQKRYPTGREASLERPEGNVEVWLQIDRSGKVLDSGIASKSKSMLLNRAALSSLQAIKQVEPFPEDAFSGESQKRFIATLNYTAP